MDYTAEGFAYNWSKENPNHPDVKRYIESVMMASPDNELNDAKGSNMAGIIEDSRGKVIMALQRYQVTSEAWYVQTALAAQGLREQETRTTAEEVQLKFYETNLATADAVRNDLKSVSKEIKQIVQSMRVLIDDPNFTIGIEDQSAFDSPYERGNFGTLYIGPNDMLYQNMAVNTKPLIEALNVYHKAKITGVPDSDLKAYKNNVNVAKSAMVSTVTHEFGHAIAYNLWNRIFVTPGVFSEEQVKHLRPYEMIMLSLFPRS